MIPPPLSPDRLWQLVYQALGQSDDIVLVLQHLEGEPGSPFIIAVNDAFCRATGYADTEVVGQPLTTLAAPDADTEIHASIAATMAKRGSLRTELLARSRQGASLWLGLHLMPAADTDGGYFVMLARDITAARQARQQQTAIQGLLAKVFLCVDAAVGIVAADGQILMTNPHLDRLLGYPPSGMVGRDSLSFVAPSSHAAVAAARQRQCEDAEDYRIEASLLRQDGSEIPVELSSVMVERHDLKRFRVVTIKPVAPVPAAAPVPMRVQVAGKIRLIGLEEVRAALGDRWPAAAERAMAAAEHIIRRRCGPRDTYGRTEDSGFVICFADATEEEAAFRASMIARDIRNRLIGEGETPSAAHVSAITASVQVPDIPNQPISAFAELIEERLQTRLTQIEGEARTRLKASVEEATCELEAVCGRDPDDVVAQFAQLPASVERSICSALAALPQQESRDFDVDRMLLGLATEQAVRGLLDGSNRPVLATVSFDVFHSRGRTDRYIEACQKLDPRLRQRLILILSQLPPGIPKSRILECVTRLRPFCRGVGFAVDDLEAPSIDLSAAAVPIIALTAETLQRAKGAATGRLAKFVATLHAQRARVLVRHVTSWDTAQRLKGMGVDLVSLAAT